MIFVAVGTQFAFDRLIKGVDEWAQAHQVPVVAQIADGEYLPKHAQWERFMTTDTFNQHLKQADLIVSHAGMGNIITSLENQKPLIVMNRQFKLGEHRNDHQADGLEWMKELPGVYAAPTVETLHDLLDQRDTLKPALAIGTDRRKQLVDFIDGVLQG